MPLAALVSLTVPALAAALVIAVAVLVLAVTTLRRAARGTELARLPLAPEHELRLDAAGPVVLHGEGPRFTSRFRSLGFRLVDRTTGARVPERRVWVHTTVAGRSRVRLALVRFDLERAGVYRLEVAGIQPAPGDEQHAFVLMPPIGMRLPLAIAAIIAAAAVAIGSLVGVGWRVFGTASEGTTVATTPVGAVAPGESAGTPAAASASASGGRQLRATPDAVGATQEVRWPAAGLTFRVPAAWQVRASGDELDVRDPTRPSTYLVGHVVTFPAPTTAAALAAVVRESAAGRLQSGLIEGFTTVRFAEVDGVLTIESRGDGASRMAVWSAYRATAAGVRNPTVLLGAAAADFDRLEGTTLAILASARFD